MRFFGRRAPTLTTSSPHDSVRAADPLSASARSWLRHADRHQKVEPSLGPGFVETDQASGTGSPWSMHDLAILRANSWAIAVASDATALRRQARHIGARGEESAARELLDAESNGHFVHRVVRAVRTGLGRPWCGTGRRRRAGAVLGGQRRHALANATTRSREQPGNTAAFSAPVRVIAWVTGAASVATGAGASEVGGPAAGPRPGQVEEEPCVPPSISTTTS